MSNSLGEALKSALAKQWASDDEAHNSMEPVPLKPRKPGTKFFETTTNITRATFNEIRDNPAERMVVQYRLKQQGYKKNSVSSIITQMLREGMVVVDTDGKLRATLPEYRPLKPWKTRATTKSQAAAPAKPKIVLTKKKARGEPQRPVSNTLFLGWSAREILENLDIFQARAVYDELKQIFGDAK